MRGKILPSALKTLPHPKMINTIENSSTNEHSSMIEITEELVEKELDKESDITVDEIAALNNDLKRWRELVIGIKQRVEQNMAEKKADSLAQGEGNFAAKQEWNAWKRKAGFFKNLVEQRLTMLKFRIREQHQEEDDNQVVYKLELNKKLNLIDKKLDLILEKLK